MTDTLKIYLTNFYNRITQFPQNFFDFISSFFQENNNIQIKENILVEDAWSHITSHLETKDLVQFQKTTKLLNKIGSAALSPSLYQHLYTMDKTLPAVLPQEEPALFLKQAFDKVYARQQDEIDYLKKHHALSMMISGPANTKIRSFETLVHRHKSLDEINYRLVTNSIDLNSNELNLKNRHITRLPEKLFQTQPKYWQELFRLRLKNNLLASLDLQEYCPSLQILQCQNNRISHLNIDGCFQLLMLDCENNNLSEISLKKHPQFRGLNCGFNPIIHLDLSGYRDTLEHLMCNDTLITTLDLENFTALENLLIENMSLTDLNLKGTRPEVRNEHRKLEIALLFEQLQTAAPAQKENIIKTRLGEDYTPENCQKYGYHEHSILNVDAEGLSETRLPGDIWALIARFLDEEEFIQFKKVSKLLNAVSLSAVALQPLYNRLYAIDKTLPPLLPQKDADLTFKQAFEKIWFHQQSEIDYLKEKHDNFTTEYTLPENDTHLLKTLEARHVALDEINSKIISNKIDINNTELNLNNAHITRFPTTLFQVEVEGDADFWQNLTILRCGDNQLSMLDVQALSNLEELYCFNNKISTLNLDGCQKLKWLDCDNNQITILNVQKCIVLAILHCSNNQLKILDVQGTALIVLNCSSNQIATLKTQELTTLQRLDCSENLISILSLQDLTALHTLHSWDNPLTVLDMQGCTNLDFLNLDDNFLESNTLGDLNLTGVPLNTRNKYAELEKSLLFKQLCAATPENTKLLITRLGEHYTPENCQKYGYVSHGFGTNSYTPSFNDMTMIPEKGIQLKEKREPNNEAPGYKNPRN